MTPIMEKINLNTEKICKSFANQIKANHDNSYSLFQDLCVHTITIAYNFLKSHYCGNPARDMPRRGLTDNWLALSSGKPGFYLIVKAFKI